MIKNEFIFDEANFEVCKNLERDLRNVIDLYESWMHIHHNENDIQQITGQWPMGTAQDEHQAKILFTKMFNKIIMNYVENQAKEES